MLFKSRFFTVLFWTLIVLLTAQCSKDEKLEKIDVEIITSNAFDFPTTIPDPFPDNEIDESEPVQANWFSMTFSMTNGTDDVITLFYIRLTVTGTIPGGSNFERVIGVTPEKIDRGSDAGVQNRSYIVQIPEEPADTTQDARDFLNDPTKMTYTETKQFYIDGLDTRVDPLRYKVKAEFLGVYGKNTEFNAKPFNKVIYFNVQ